jgi:hypothetical protein
MNRDLASIKSIVLVANAPGSPAGAAHAGDSSLSLFGDDRYVYFHENKQTGSDAGSRFRPDNPNGSSVSEYQLDVRRGCRRGSSRDGKTARAMTPYEPRLTQRA